MRPLVVCCVLLLAGCASDVPDADAVDWDDYPPGTYQRIQGARQDHDCETLLRLSDQAKDSKYKDFVEDTLKQAGCYD